MHKKCADYDFAHKHTFNSVCSCLEFFTLILVYRSTHFKICCTFLNYGATNYLKLPQFYPAF
jgi:hypothetical protein